MDVTVDRNDHISGTHLPHLHHVVILESLAARVNMSAARAQVQWALMAAERHPLGTPLVTLLLCLGEALRLDNVARHVVRDEVSG